jgi:IS30 family transposase
MARVDRARQIKESIRRVLLHDWDPIGVSAVPEAQHEYDSYVGGIYRLLASGASTDEVAKHLAHIERDSMRLSTSANSVTNVAEKLCSIDVNTEGGSA